jgi:DNA-binding NarL/FixJ family response regulator
MAKRILIADDDSSVRRAIRSFIENRFQFDIYEAADEALQQAAVLNPDLVALDLSMPTANGVEVAALLHSRTPRMPVVIYTMHGDLVRESLAKILGIAALVPKSDGVGKLLGRITPARRAGRPREPRALNSDSLCNIGVDRDEYLYFYLWPAGNEGRSGGLQAGVPVAASLPRHLAPPASPDARPLSL